MRVVVIANQFQKEELLAQGLKDDVDVHWQEEIKSVPATDCYIDLLFTASEKRIELLQQLRPALVVVNNVVAINMLPNNFIRINGWPAFLQRPIVEASGYDEAAKEKAAKVFSGFHKTISWVPGNSGFITARIVSMIINEAYLALQEGVSTKEEIDIAMKLGTNYPYGPFEWAAKIGTRNVYDLLSALAAEKSHYSPAALLKKEAE